MSALLLIGVFIAFLVFCAVAVILCAVFLPMIAPSTKEQLIQARLRTEKLRAARLANDLAVVEHRAQKLSNDVVLGDMKIELARRALAELEKQDFKEPPNL